MSYMVPEMNRDSVCDIEENAFWSDEIQQIIQLASQFYILPQFPLIMSL